MNSQIELLQKSIIELRKRGNFTLPDTKANLYHQRVKKGIVDDYINKHIIKEIGKERVPFFGFRMTDADKYGYEKLQCGYNINRPVLRNMKNALLTVNIYSEFVQNEFIDKELKLTAKIKPLYQELDFLKKNEESVNKDYKYWFDYNKIMEAISLSKGNLPLDVLQQIYAILIQYEHNDENIDVDEVNNLVKENKLILTPKIIKKIEDRFY